MNYKWNGLVLRWPHFLSLSIITVDGHKYITHEALRTQVEAFARNSICLVFIVMHTCRSLEPVTGLRSLLMRFWL